MVKNIIEDVVYVAPIQGLPIPDGMCKGDDCTKFTTAQVEPILDESAL